MACSFELNIYNSEMADGWQTVDKITEAVAEPKYSDFLITYILSNVDGVLYDRRNPVHLELIGIGALTIKKKNIMVSSPLIRSILLKNVVSLKKYNIQILPIKDYLLDVPTLIRYVAVVHNFLLTIIQVHISV